MKLYALSGACSLASLISLNEAGIKVDLGMVDRRTRQVDGVDFSSINPKGYVPALKLDSGEVLTENVVVLQYIADLKPEAKLAPPVGTLARLRLAEWLSFINSEVHKNYSPLFNPDASEEMKSYFRKNLAKRLAYVEKSLGDKQFLTGDQFTVADAYLFVVLSWSPKVGVEVSPKLKSFSERVQKRPSVVAAFEAEGIKKH